MKFENFSIAKIEFLWRALNFKRGHGPPFSAAYGQNYQLLLVNALSCMVFAALDLRLNN